MELSRKEILGLFQQLSDALQKRNTFGDVLVFGGSALCLGYGLRESTVDIDAIFEPTAKVREAVLEVARNTPGLTEDWMNDGVKGFIFSSAPNFVIWETPFLRVSTVSADYLLAMKMHSMRMAYKDVEDVKNLIHYLGLNSTDQVFHVVSQYIPLDRIPMRSRYVVMNILDQKA